MATTPIPERHIWYSPAEIAAWLEAERHGEEWRARCPAHGGENPTALKISEGRDSYGNPTTLLHCFAHDCTVQDLCAALGIRLRNLFCIHPAYAKATRNRPRSHSPVIAKIRQRTTPLTPDEMAQIMLEAFIVSDPEWIQDCAPARAKMWELAQASVKSREALTRALQQAGLHPRRFWDVLAREQKGAPHGSDH